MGKTTQVFRYPEEIPSPLRKKLIHSTRGMNSATILIADRGGRAEIRKILNGQPSPLKSRLRADFLRRSIGEPEKTSLPSPPRFLLHNWRVGRLSDLLLPGLVALGLWLLFASK